jgi:outer membrane lipoprotein carrier protein
MYWINEVKMNKFSKLCSILIASMMLVLSFPSNADNATATATATAIATTTATDLSDLLNQMKTMRADFTQDILDGEGRAVQKSHGRIALDRPGKFRWEVTKPMPQVIIANGERLWVYDPDLQQVTIRSLKSEAGEAPGLLLSHQNTTLEKDYVIEAKGADRRLRWFSLASRKKDAIFASVKMGFAGNQLKEMILEDQIGHTTRVRFARVETNVKLPASLFIFNAPAGTDVIDETKK